MPAREENRLKSGRGLPQKIAIIAGRGLLPSALARSCLSLGLEPLIVAFKGQTDLEPLRGLDHFWIRLGRTGTLLKRLKQEGISDLVMIGGMRRPSLSELRPDWKTLEFFTKYGLSALGDDGFLKALRVFLEKEGFQIHGFQAFMPELLTPEGVLGRHMPQDHDRADILRGVAVLKALAPLDVGQAVLVQNGMVLGIEAAEGTDALILRCAGLKRQGVQGGVLVKLSKTGQDPDLDLPAMGPQTIEHMIQSGLSGVAIEAGASSIVEKERTMALADRNGIFVLGIVV